MSTLHTLQKLAKLGKVLSKIVFIFALIGAIGCAAGIVSLALLPESVQLGSVTIKGLVDLTDEIHPETVIIALAGGVILCVGEAVLAKLAERYFKNELAAGTPFTFEGAEELKRLGIFAICIPIAAKVLAEIVCSAMQHWMHTVRDIGTGDPISLGLGIMLIVAGLLCKYGAELRQGTAVTPDEGLASAAESRHQKAADFQHDWMDAKR